MEVYYKCRLFATVQADILLPAAMGGLIRCHYVHPHARQRVA